MAFFIQARNGSGDIFEMDATVSVAYSLMGSPTEYLMGNGLNSSDHYTQNPDTISFTGLVSQVKFARRSSGSVTTSLEDFEKGMQALKQSGQFFSCSFSDNLSIKKNCLFTSLRMERNDSTSDKSISVSFTIKQVLQGSQTQVTSLPIPANLYKDVVESKEKGGASTTAASAKELEGLPALVYKLDPTAEKELGSIFLEDGT